MGALTVFIRTLLKSSAIFLGVTVVFLHPSLDWSSSRAVAHKHPREAAIDGLLAALKDRDMAVRSQAAAALGELKSPRAIATLASDLESSDAETRARAACGLRQHRDAAQPALASLIKLLADGTPVDASVCGRRWFSGQTTTPGEQAASALVAIGAAAFEPVLDTMKSAEWVARRNAAFALGKFRNDRAVPALLAALRDPNERVRAQAAGALGIVSQ